MLVSWRDLFYSLVLFLFDLASLYRLQRPSSSEHSAGRNSTSWKSIKDGPSWQEKIVIFREYLSLPSKASLSCIPALTQHCFQVDFFPFSYHRSQGWITFLSQGGQRPITLGRFFRGPGPAMPSCATEAGQTHQRAPSPGENAVCLGAFLRVVLSVFCFTVHCWKEITSSHIRSCTC